MATKIDRSCFSLKPLAIPDSWWFKVAAGECPFCEKKDFALWKPKGEKIYWKTCRNCLRVYILPKKIKSL